MTDLTEVVSLVLAVVSTLAGVVGALAAVAQLRASRSSSPSTDRSPARREGDLPVTGAVVPGPVPAGATPRGPTGTDAVEALREMVRGPSEPDRVWMWWWPVALAVTSGILTGVLIVGQHAWLAYEGKIVLVCWLIGAAIVVVAVASLARFVGERGWRRTAWRWRDLGVIGLLIIATIASPGTLVSFVVLKALFVQIVGPLA